MNSKIEEYFMNPQNVGVMENPDIFLNVGNPVCGDTIHLGIRLKDNVIAETLFKAYGCSTSIATANILSEFLINKSISELREVDRESISDMLGELEPKERHCIDIGESMVSLVIENMEKQITKSQVAL